MADEAYIRGRELLTSGDIPGLFRYLRFHAEEMTLVQLADLVGPAAATHGFKDLEDASRALGAPGGQGTPQLIEFRLACEVHDLEYLAIEPMFALMETMPELAVNILVPLLEDEERHDEVVALLEAYDPYLNDFLQLCLVENLIATATLDKARTRFAEIPKPPDEADLTPGTGYWTRLRHTLDRADLAATFSPLDAHDLCGWHFVLTGGLLTTLSPQTIAQGMNGRWAEFEDSFAQCALAISRLATALKATAQTPTTISPLPDRDSHILAAAIARLLALPTVPFDAARTNTLVVAYDLRAFDEDVLDQLIDRQPGQILFEHATSWTDPTNVAADISTLLCESHATPWAHNPLDAETLADQIAQATPLHEADGASPSGHEDDLVHFAHAANPAWLTGSRVRMSYSGPVRSPRST